MSTNWRKYPVWGARLELMNRPGLDFSGNSIIIKIAYN